MSGESDGYRSIALQSQALSQNANLGDTIFSNFTVTPKGRVSFDVAFTIPKGDLSFAKNIDNSPIQAVVSTDMTTSLDDSNPLIGETVDGIVSQEPVLVR
jgi:hypothetical protein